MVKKILVPTDFSIQAEIAVDAARKIAHQLRNEIIFYHCSEELPSEWESWPLERQEQDSVHFPKYQFLVQKMQELTDRCSADMLTCTFIIESGNFLQKIEKLVGSEAYDLIIMGSHGASGKQEYFIGSNTQKVIRKVHNNLMIIKEPLSDSTFEKVLFATNLGLADQEAFSHFLKFIKPFQVKEIHLLTVDTPGFFTQPRVLVEERQQDFKKMATAYHCETHFAGNFTVEHGIRKFAGDLGVDLIAVSNRERHPLKRIFAGSNVEMLANHSDLPVLSLDFKVT
ncbi:MAG: universal stress protein [Saprospiraceae bacterium]|nr:universal stress protein [Saprospiraceae bacterium]